MKNKKGFTLIEILSVLVILSLTIIVGFSTLTKSLNNVKESAYNEQINRIMKVTKTWVVDNINSLNLSENETYYLYINELKVEKIIDEIPIDPRTNKKIDGCIKIFNSGNYNKIQYDYMINDNCPRDGDIYNITYELNGGVLNDENPISYTVNTPTFVLNNPTKKDYKFSGWSLNGSDEINVVTTLYKGSVGDKKYTAHWNKLLHIQIDPNGGEYSGETDFYKVAYDEFDLLTPTREGYTFGGWESSVADVNINGNNVVLGENSVLIIAKWNPINYTITYNLNGGSGVTKNTYTIEDEFTLITPEKKGYAFTGWTGSNGVSPSKEVKINKGSTGNKSYTANWQIINYNIVYNLNGGSVSNPTSYTVETSSITLENPTRDGYTFTGWTGTGLSSASTSVTIPKGSTGNKSYTANWLQNTFRISLASITGGTATLSKTSAAKSESVTVNYSAYEGYKFKSITATNATVSGNTVIPNGNGDVVVTVTFESLRYYLYDPSQGINRLGTITEFGSFSKSYNTNNNILNFSMSGSEWDAKGGYSGSALISFSGYSRIVYDVVQSIGSKGSGSDFEGTIGFMTGQNCSGSKVRNMWSTSGSNYNFIWKENILDNSLTGYFCTYLYANNYGNYSSNSSISFSIRRIWIERD